MWVLYNKDISAMIYYVTATLLLLGSLTLDSWKMVSFRIKVIVDACVRNKSNTVNCCYCYFVNNLNYFSLNYASG